MVYMAAATYSWKLQSLDFTSAFLQGEEIQRNIFLRPPSDVCSRNEVWALRKCLYGLTDAPHSWYRKMKKALIDLGGVQSAYDNALFIWYNEDKTLRGIIASHVEEEVKISQNDYISNIETIEISRERTLESELTEDERSQLKSLSGQMIWAASQTRPDVSYETCVMSNTGKHPTVKMIKDANKAVAKLKGRNVSINFKNLGKPKQLKIKVYMDATHNSLPDGASQGGFVVFLEGKDGKVVPMSWQSKKLHRVTKSPLASETLALGEGADAGFLIASMIKEVFGLTSLPAITCITDSSSLVQNLHTSKISCDRRLRVDMSRLREMVQNKEITVLWCSGKLQLSDCLTKNTASSSSLLAAISA